MNIKDFKYNVGEIINDRLILERSRGGIDSNSKNLKRYKCKCIAENGSYFRWRYGRN